MLVDVVLLAALSDEELQLKRMLKDIGARPVMVRTGRFFDYEVHRLPTGHTVVVGPPTSMGQLKAAITTARLLADLRPSVVVLGGIAGCMKPSNGSEHTLGDVVVSDQIVDYELEKVRDSGIERRSTGFPCPIELVQYVQARRSEWPVEHGELPPRPDTRRRTPRVHIGTVLSGNQVLASATEKHELCSQHPNAIAIEMEAAGIAAMLHAMSVPRFLMVKAFTDWADGTKSDKWRPYGCQVSAAYIGFLLREIFPAYLRLFDQPNENEQRFRDRLTDAFQSFLGAGAQEVPFIQEMSRSILDRAIAETCSLANLTGPEGEPYDIHVGVGHQFLLRARPLFLSAKRIFATSLDSVSKFWIDARNREVAQKYIDTHAGPDAQRDSVMRLFVFSAPKAAHEHAHVLDYHAQRFENTLLCSREQYERLLRRIAPYAVQDYLKRDFAVLECPTRAGDRLFFADLDYDAFSLQVARLESNGGADVNCRKTIELFEELARIKPGVLDPELKVLKWQTGHWQNHRGRWAAHLTEMFGDPTADVFHLVTFNISPAEYRELRSVLAEIKYQILVGDDRGPSTLAERHGVSDVWLAKQIPRDQPPLIDSTTGGNLFYDNNSSMKYVLLMRFADIAKLDNFMRDPEHLQMRLQVFRRFNGPVQNLMKQFEIHTPADLQRAPETTKTLYEALEALSAHRMRRYDYLEDELISEIVRIEPLAFG